MCRPPATKRLSPCGYSLVEMLVVLAIIGIMTGLLVPPLTGLTRSGRLTTSGNLTLNLASLARQLAASKNTMTALVLLGNQGTPDDFRALTLLEFDPASGWRQASRWERFPDGCIVDFTDVVNCTFIANSPPTFPLRNRGATQANPPVFYAGQQVRSAAYAARIYLPSGSLLNPEQPAQLRVVEGYRVGDLVNYTHRDRAGGGPVNYYDVAVIGSTGIPKAMRP